MPAGKRQQNAMLYTVIVFVGLFILSTVLAVVFYLQAEKYRTGSTTLQNQIDDLATGAELQKIGTIVGAKQPRKSRLGTMVDYLDGTVSLIIGGLPEDKSAEVKVDTVNRKIKDLLGSLDQKLLAVEIEEPNIPTNKLVTLLADQQFAAAIEDFNEILKNELPVEKLEETWKAVVDQVGPFKKQLGIRTEKQQDANAVIVTCEFENGNLDVTIVYNNQEQVAGLLLAPTPPEVSESYRPKASAKAQKSYIDIDDPNTIGLVRVIEKLVTQLENATNAEAAFKQELERLNNRFDDAMEVTREKEQALLAEKEKYQQQVDDVMQDYNDLKIMVQQTADQQIQTCMTQLEEEKTGRKDLNQQLLKTNAELSITRERVKRIQSQLDKLVPPPDSEIAAYKPDAKIILIDEATKTVHLNIGRDDHVYQGLTFSVYEKNLPIPNSGRGKAEIEVFNVDKNISRARITISNPKKPVIVDDIVANLIWDGGKTNNFVVSGEFDLNGDGEIDYEGAEKIKAIIKKWGGTAADDVSIETDFLVLGTTPIISWKPTFEQMEADPMAMERYEASLQKLEAYKEVQSRAEALSIPVFNLERFLYFTGYKTLSARPDAFID